MSQRKSLGHTRRLTLDLKLDQCAPYGRGLARVSHERCCSVLVLISLNAAAGIYKDLNSKNRTQT